MSLNNPTKALRAMRQGIPALPLPITRPALRYYGGKFAAATRILRHLPPHICYCEPFGGAASVLLRKPKSEIEVYNDLDLRIFRFFEVLRNRCDALIQVLQATPFHRYELQLAMEGDDPADELEAARRFYIRAWQSYGGHQNTNTGWRFQHSLNRGTRVVDDWRRLEHLPRIVERLQQVLFEYGDYSVVLKRYDQPHTVFYCDPPYPKQTRSKMHGSKGYRFELSEDEHRILAKHLRPLTGMVLLSSYPSTLYEELYSDWGWKCVRWTAQTNSSAVRTECLWLNPKAVNAFAHRQLSFLEGI